MCTHIEQLRALWKEENEKNTQLRRQVAIQAQLANRANSINQMQLAASLDLHSNPNLKLLCRCVRQQMRALLSVQDASLYIADPQRSELFHHSESGQLLKVRYGQGVLGELAQRAILEQDQVLARGEPAPPIQEEHGNMLCIVVMENAAFCGVLQLVHDEDDDSIRSFFGEASQASPEPNVQSSAPGTPLPLPISYNNSDGTVTPLSKQQQEQQRTQIAQERQAQEQQHKQEQRKELQATALRTLLIHIAVAVVQCQKMEKLSDVVNDLALRVAESGTSVLSFVVRSFACTRAYTLNNR